MKTPRSFLLVIVAVVMLTSVVSKPSQVVKSSAIGALLGLCVTEVGLRLYSRWQAYRLGNSEEFGKFTWDEESIGTVQKFRLIGAGLGLLAGLRFRGLIT